MNEVLRRFLWLPPQASTVAEQIDWLHYFVILVTIFGTLLVPIVGAIFLIKYHRPGQGLATKPSPIIADPPISPDSEVVPTKPKEGNVPFALEMIVIAFLLSLFVLWWFIGFRQYMHLRVPPEDSLEVYVIAKQWMWKFSYPEGGASVSNVYVPAGRPIKLIMTSRDVIHSFSVPDFRIKQDVLPGRYTTVWFEVKEPGVYDVFCTEYCGTGHSMMRGQVVALSPGDYEKWIDKKDTLAVANAQYDEPAVIGDFAPREDLSLAKQGEIASARLGCLRCHSVDGTPHIGPTWSQVYGSRVSLVTGETVLVDEAYLTDSMMDPKGKIRAQFEAVMPSYQGILTPADTAAIVQYIKALQEKEFSPSVPPMEAYSSQPTSQASTQAASTQAASTQASTLPGSLPASTQPDTAPVVPGQPSVP